MKNKEKIINYLNNTKNPYELKIENMVVKIEYSNNKKQFDECIVSILKQKLMYQ